MPTYVGVGTQVNGTSTLSVPSPAGVQANDLLIMFICTANAHVDLPINWSGVPGAPISTGIKDTAGGVRLTALYRFAASTPASNYPLSDSGFNYRIAQIVAFRDVDLIAPFDTVATSKVDSSSTSSKSWPTITTTANNSIILNALGMDSDAFVTTNLSNWVNSSLASITELIDYTVSTGTGGGIGLSYGAKTTAGLVSATTATKSSSSKDVYLSIAIRHTDNTLSLQNLCSKIASKGGFDAQYNKYTCLKDLDNLLDNMNTKRTGTNTCTSHTAMYTETGKLSLGDIVSIVAAIKPCACNSEYACTTYAPGTPCPCNTQSCSCNSNCPCNSDWDCSCENVGGCNCVGDGYGGGQCWTYEGYEECPSDDVAPCSCNSETCTCNSNCTCNSDYACTCNNVTGACTCESQSVCTCVSFYS